MTTYGDVPLLDPDTGRFPDSFAPPSVKQDREAAQTARTGAEQAQQEAHTALAATYVSLEVRDGRLYGTKHDDTEVDLGHVKGDKGDKGDQGDKGDAGKDAEVTQISPGIYQIGAN